MILLPKSANCSSVTYLSILVPYISLALIFTKKNKEMGIFLDKANGAVEVSIHSGDTHPILGISPYLYAIYHSHTKQVKRFVDWTKGRVGGKVEG